MCSSSHVSLFWAVSLPFDFPFMPFAPFLIMLSKEFLSLHILRRLRDRDPAEDVILLVHRDQYGEVRGARLK